MILFSFDIFDFDYELGVDVLIFYWFNDCDILEVCYFVLNDWFEWVNFVFFVVGILILIILVLMWILL